MKEILDQFFAIWKLFFQVQHFKGTIRFQIKAFLGGLEKLGNRKKNYQIKFVENPRHIY